MRIESSNLKHQWSTIGVSCNVVDASYIALHDSITYHLLKSLISKKNVMKKNRNCFVDTQLPENLGSVTRGMLNFGFEKLRIVSPKFPMTNEKIIPSVQAQIL